MFIIQDCSFVQSHVKCAAFITLYSTVYAHIKTQLLYTNAAVLNSKWVYDFILKQKSFRTDEYAFFL